VRHNVSRDQQERKLSQNKSCEFITYPTLEATSASILMCTNLKLV
jgi:hypothetical protein